MVERQVLYKGRWVSREHFRAFVFNKEGQKLAKSYHEFSNLISSGLWFQDKPVDEPVASTKTIETEENNVIDIKPKRGRKCRSQHNQ